MRIVLGVAMLLCMISLTSKDAMAWDDNGHKIVALIADHYLLPAVREKITNMLSTDTDKLTAHDIASEATWADKLLDSDRATTRQRMTNTSDWHFANIQAARPNIPEACFGQPPLMPGTLASQGPAEACVISKIGEFATELADSKVGADERLLALKFLLNLVGDVHQPLRVADENNSHGARILVSAPDMTPGDLFTFWDSVLVAKSGVNSDDVARALVSRISEGNEQQWASSAPQLWALEAHQLGVDRAYGMLSAFDDQGRFALQAGDIDKGAQIVALQLSRAGVRLAHVLNEALAPTSVQTSTVKAGNSAAGRQFALSACTVCHVVSPGQTIARNSTTAPDFQAIAKTRGISDAALHEFLFGPHPTMPTIKLSQTQADDIIAYILDLRDTQ